MKAKRPRQPRGSGSGRSQPSGSGSGNRNHSRAAESNRNRIRTLAEQQFGLATWAQMRGSEIARATIHRAVDTGRLHVVHPGVYSIVPPSLMQFNARLAAAILAGGPAACLCHLSAAHWARLAKTRPREIHVAIAGERKPIAGIRWHRLKLTDDERIVHDGMPMTALERLPLDLAKDFSRWDLKGVLAELEYHHDIDPSSVILRRGYAGAAKLRRAIADHTPQLAETRSELERVAVRFLTDRSFELPEFNHPVGLSTVDAIYRQLMVVIELDGVKGHSGERRVLRDHRRDLRRRHEGFTPLRYHYAQFFEDGDLIEAELDRLGVPRLSAF